MQHDASNTIFQLAADLVNYTSKHIFLTGKAGTGKTTFLKYIKDNTKKNTVVVAPTGVAAINAGGVTIHSFFQLPFAPYVPSYQHASENGWEVINKHSLFQKIRLTTNKREIMQELELLIIDEVSMVRCDVLDAIDAVLRHFRKQPMLPFGGVQVVYIGDLFQLPPVAQHAEWNILNNYYEHTFFFNSKVVAEAPPLYIELKKIYRQNEQSFIDILNRVRNNAVQEEDLQLLNSLYQPTFDAAANKYVTLCTHNYKADKINETELAKLPGKIHSFKADVEGDFYEHAFPTEVDLQLKEGAQIMFIKNDSGNERRFFNGKLATVKSITEKGISISFNSGEEDLLLEKEEWKNVRYIYEKENDKVQEEELGLFRQYPIRLAWAITIHKSQGLTFNKAVIDAGAAFAAGQVYVALSRCTSLDGIVLYSKIHPHAIATDPRVIAFAEKEADDDTLLHTLKEEKENFQAEALKKTFVFAKVQTVLEDWLQVVDEKHLSKEQKATETAEACLAKANELAEVADKFILQLKQLIHQSRSAGSTTALKERLEKAIDYFSGSITKDILQPVQLHLAEIQYASRIKKYKSFVEEVEAVVINLLKKINNISYGDINISNNVEVQTKIASTKSGKKGKVEKGATYKITLDLFKEGKSVEEIAKLRNLAISTISGHLASMVEKGEVDVLQLVEEPKLQKILEVIKITGDASSAEVKLALPGDFTYTEIKAAIGFYRLQNASSASAPVATS